MEEEGEHCGYGLSIGVKSGTVRWNWNSHIVGISFLQRFKLNDDIDIIERHFNFVNCTF